MPKTKNIPTPAGFAGIDVSALCRNWTQDKLGIQRRMGNKAKAIQNLAHGANHALGRYPRPMFSKAIPVRDLDTTGIDPFLRWYYNDSVVNGRTYRVHVIALPRTDTTNQGKVAQWSGADTYYATQIPQWQSAQSSSGVSRYADVFHVWFTISRGAAAAARVTDGISTFEGFTVLSVNVVEDPLPVLHPDIHDVANSRLALQGGRILVEAFETVRDAVQTVRENNLPIVIWWSSLGDVGTTAAPGDCNGATVTDAGGDGLVNLFDQSVTSRDGNSPGFCVDVHRAGRGPADETWGQRVKIQCYALADADATRDGLLRFAGPGGNADVIITGGGGLDIYGTGSTILYLDSSNASGQLGPDMNKIDVLGEIQGGHAGTYHVYGLYAWVVYE